MEDTQRWGREREGEGREVSQRKKRREEAINAGKIEVIRTRTPSTRETKALKN